MKNKLLLIIGMGFSLSGFAQQSPAMEETVVTSTASETSLQDVVQPVQVLDGKALQQQSGNTLGAVLANTPGVANASFGAGVGRPMLRGLGGNRVRVMENGSDAADVSAMSSDHSAMVDPVNADQVEIIQGPGTLLYGGGAIGGIVNVVTERIHNQAVDGISGRVTVQASTVDDGRQLTAMMDAGGGQWVLHMEGFKRSADDYAAGSEDDFADTVFNSDVDGNGGNLALSWIAGDKGYAGISFSRLDYDYAVPNDEGENARVKPEQNRLELETGWYDLLPGIEEWITELAFTDYQHEETDDDFVEGLFEQQALELKTRFSHAEVAGFSGTFGVHLVHKALDVCHDHAGCSDIPDYDYLGWDGSQGVNLVLVDDYLFSHDTPIPLTETDDIGVFWVENREWQYGMLEMGLRLDQRTITADPANIRPASRQAADYYADKDFDLVSVNLGATWRLSETHQLGLSLASAQRAPDAEELYWNGNHHATFSYQLDNPTLHEETARTANLNWRYQADNMLSSVNVFYYDFDDYIYNAPLAITDPFHGDPVYRHEQADAVFSGMDFSLNRDLGASQSGWLLDLFGDYVRARLTHGDNRNLPRIPPASLGAGISWQDDVMLVRLDTRYYAKQTDVAENETETDGYQTVNLQVRRESAWQQQRLWFSAKLNNMTNEFGQNHVSYLKRVAPVPGRNLVLEVGMEF